MNPGDLRAESFTTYTPGARALAVEYLAVLQAMPLSLLPSYLVQVQEYDTLFPVEQERLRRQLGGLREHPELAREFAAIRLTPELEQANWVGRPKLFVAQLAGALWQSGQIDAYHTAAGDLLAALPQATNTAASQPPMLVAVFGQGAVAGGYPLFTRLRASGLHARKVDGAGALEAVSQWIARRAGASSGDYKHWYVDGGRPWTLAGAPVHAFAFPQFAPVTDALLVQMNKAVQEGWGPEVLSQRLQEMPPRALRMEDVTTDPRTARFFLSVLTEGSGTQLYSTSFVQATAVELVRRAQPETLLIRFAPRRRPASMNDMLEQRGQSYELDPQGSLIDADMGLYYAWLAMRRQPDGARATLLAYAEAQGEAFLVSPRVTRGVESTTGLSVEQMLEML
jgi:hypothetical protein